MIQSDPVFSVRTGLGLWFTFILLLCCSACWEELKAVARRRQDHLQTAEECHRLYQDLSDALTLIQVFIKRSSRVRADGRWHEASASFGRSGRRASPMTRLKICEV